MLNEEAQMNLKSCLEIATLFFLDCKPYDTVIFKTWESNANDRWSIVLIWAINAQANNIVVFINVKRDQPFKVNS